MLLMPIFVFKALEITADNLLQYSHAYKFLIKRIQLILEE